MRSSRLQSAVALWRQLRRPGPFGHPDSEMGEALTRLASTGGLRVSEQRVMADPPLPEPLLRFLDLYRAGRYWDSHEALEDLWRETGSAFYQALILYASAWVHWERRNAHGVDAQLRKALERLAGYPAAYLGVDVTALREHCDAMRRALADHPDNWHEHVAPTSLTLSASGFRGDEVELTP